MEICSVIVFGLLGLFALLDIWSQFKMNKRFKRIEKHLGISPKD